RPPFNVSAVAQHLPERGKTVVLLLQRNLVVVTGNRLVKEKIFVGQHVVFLRIRHRHVKDPGARTIQRAWIVLRTRRSLTERFRTPNLKRRLRLLVEQLLEVWLHPFMDSVEVFDHLLCRRERHQLLSRAQVVEERLEIPLEARLLHHGFHLPRDALHFLFPQLEHLFRGHVCRRVILDEELIILPAIGYFADARGFTTRREVLFFDEVGEAFVYGYDLLTDHLFIRLRQPLPVFRRKRFGHLLDGSIKVVVGNRAVVEFAYLRNHALRQHLRKDVSFRHALAHVHDGGIAPFDVVGKAGKPVLVVFHRRERLKACPAGELADHQGQRPKLVYRHEVFLELQAFETQVAVEGDDVVAEPVFLIQRIPVDSAEPVLVVLIKRSELFAERGGYIVVQRVV